MFNYILLSFFFLLSLLAFISNIASAEILYDVVAQGNSKTSKNAIIRHAMIPVGTEFSSSDLAEVKERLSRSTQFTTKQVTFQDGVLAIEIEEKWTLFPIPMITQSGDYYSRGFLIYEASLVGSLGEFAPGLTWTNSGLNGLVYYQDESLFTSDTGFKILVMRKNDMVFFRRHDEIKNEFESRYDSILFTPNYLYKNHVFKAGPIYLKKSIHDEHGVQIFANKGTGIFLRHHINAYQMTETQMDGFVTTYSLILIRSKEQDQTIVFHEADAKLSRPYKQHFYNLEVHGHHVNDNSYLYPKILGGVDGYRGYDKESFPAQWNLGTLMQFQYNFYKRFFLAPFHEYNHSKLINEVFNGKTIGENTVGVGLRYYFKKISIPAVSFDLSRNIEDQSTHFLFNVGLNM